MLQKDIEKWYPLAIDTIYGGFFSDINYKWELAGAQNKFIVTQARHIWTCAKLSEFYHNDYYTKIAKHGFEFLKNVMWDKKYGGFFDLVTRKGKPIKENNKIIKKAYGHAFVIYGLSAYFEVSNDSSALKLAQKTFEWLENHSYDTIYGGYFQFISEKGEPFVNGYNGTPPKDYNSMIHILEAYTELYKTWKNEKLKERLTSLFYLIRDKVTTDKGYMRLYFQRDWTPVEFNYSSTDKNKNFLLDHVSFGHDIETAYLLLEAAEILGIKDSLTIIKAKTMVNHTISNGWDSFNGGIFDAGYYFKDKDSITIIKNTKEWWSQAEALNSFLLMSELFPEDRVVYYNYFKSQWEYIKKYLIDNINQGWFIGGIDIVPENKFSPKSTIWKCNYHTTRALINCINTLERNNNYK
ncbi:AGE family epimerase/isomerase [Rosettibacter firmus]|uniref:AGE family epimerase/isomerase n=1 Tax=Rosettibacter firmus TaxID=3111522 RepID=UPI00336C2123